MLNLNKYLMKTNFRIFLLTILSASYLVGCGGGGGGEAKSVSTNNRVVEHILSELERLNPQNSTGANETYVEEMIFERLLRINPETMEVNIPWLAEEMPIESEDHRTFDFKLRKGIKFADGKELTGHDVIFSLKSLKNPLNTMSAQKRVYVDGIHSCELIDGDPYRVRFTMWKPYFLTVQQAFSDILYILPKHIYDPKGLTDKYSWDDIAAIIEAPGAGEEVDPNKVAKMNINPAMKEYAEYFTSAELGRDPKYIQGSGPYKLAEWRTNDRIILVRNPLYVNKGGSKFGEVSPDTLIYKVISDWAATVTALKAQDIDLIGFLQPPYYVKVDTSQAKHIKKTTFTLSAYALINWNNKSVFFNDSKVRWAMAHLIDKKTIIDKVLYGLAKPTQSPNTPSRKEYNPNLAPIEYDVAKAKQLLTEAGWTDSDGDGILDKTVGGKKVPFSFTFMVNAGNETRKQILLIITESLRKVGIKAEVAPIEWSIFLDRQRDHNFDASYGSWQSDPFESDNYQLYHSSQARNRGSNYPQYMSKRADALLEGIRAEFDEAKRMDLQKQFQQVLYEDQPITILWNPENPSAWVDRFDNVTWHPVRPGYIQALWKVRGAAGGGKKQVAAGY